MAAGPEIEGGRTIDVLRRQLAAAVAERDEAQARQVALAEVLQAINAASGDFGSVFNLIIGKAMALCDAPSGGLVSVDGDHASALAFRDTPKALTDYWSAPQYIDPNTGMGQVLRQARTIHHADMAASEPYKNRAPMTVSGVELGGIRSFIMVPLVNQRGVIGIFVIWRYEVRPFSDRQIALVEAFAAQAMLAMENARLFAEQREALEQQTATTEVLEVINASPGDLKPVFDTMLERAMRLCEAKFGMFARFDGEATFTFVAYRGVPAQLQGVGQLQSPPSDSGLGRLMAGEPVVQIVDLPNTDIYRSGFIGVVALVAAGAKTAIFVALRKDERLMGAIIMYRSEATAFTDRQVALLQNFAAQAVIAIENARLLNETRETLEQQTATADILRVIAQSPTDVAPVLNVVVRAAQRFCGAEDVVISLREGDELAIAAHEGPIGAPPSRRKLDRSSTQGRAVVDGSTVHLPDIARLDPAEWGAVVALSQQMGANASLAAPLLREGAAVGAIMLRKRVAGAFTERQIQLLETFAAQAVIAIQNVRLFTELRETLEQQTASAEILQVISSSPTDVAPVMAAVAKAAVRFCGAEDAHVFLREGDEIVSSAHEGPLSAHPLGHRDALDIRLSRAQSILEARVTHIVDTEALDPREYALTQAYAVQHGFRAQLNAPMLQEGRAIGCICLRRREPGPFTQRQIELLEAFAAQAVIAIQNVRLFTELRESLEQQTASTEILHVISQSPTDVQPVLHAVAKAALHFCGATDAVITLRHGDEYVHTAHEGVLTAAVGVARPLDRSNSIGRAIVDGRTVHLPDMDNLDPAEWGAARELAATHGLKAAIATPLLREGVAIGGVLLRKGEPGPFTPRQIQLLEAFAAQAVIAIENVRLFTELRDSLERLKAAQANLVQSEKMATLGQLTAGIAHEIKNPLNFVNNFASLSVELLGELKEVAGPALATLDEDKRAELDETMSLLIGNLGKITEHGKRADGIVKSMLSHSRGGAGDWQPSDINALVEEALNLAYHGARAQDKEFNVTLERDLEKTSKPIDLVPQDVTRVFLNLFGNGFYAANKRRLANKASGFKPTMRVTTRDLGDKVEVKVRDNGTGIPPDVREKLFQPFFTTKPTGEGTGLGLSISYDIVTQQHGGTIEVESEPDQFTEFTVRLPRSRRVVEARGA